MGLTVPPSLIAMRSDLCTIINEIAKLEQMVVGEEVTSIPASRQRLARVYRSIEQRAVQACERIGVTAKERQAWQEKERQYLEVLGQQRDELARRQHTIDHLTREQGA